MTTTNLIVHPVPVEETPSMDYAVTVNGMPVPVQQARVSKHPFNQVWPGYQRPLEQTELASFAIWDMEGPVDVEIISLRRINSVRVRPTAAGIQPIVKGQTIRFTLTKPGQIVVEINDSHKALHLFANPIEKDAPDPKDAGVRYFGPGVHCPGTITLASNQTVYLAAGAVVYANIIAEKAENITIRGRGILDGSKMDRMDAMSLVVLFDCKNVRIEGITLRDPAEFSITPVACQEVHISNVKLIGHWRYNSDGIDFFNCRKCSIEDSFIRSFDDSICIKGYKKFGQFIFQLQLVDGKWDGTFSIGGDTRHTFTEWEELLGKYPCNAAATGDIAVRRCVLWNDWGRALEIGAETVASEISNLLFEDCDIIHATEVVMDIQNCDRARCHNMTFRNIRVELDYDPTPPTIQQKKDDVYPVKTAGKYNPSLINLSIAKGYASYDTVRGQIDNIHFKDIFVTANTMPRITLSGHDADHLVQNVTIENLNINGRKMTSLESADVSKNEFVGDVKIS